MYFLLSLCTNFNMTNGKGYVFILNLITVLKGMVRKLVSCSFHNNVCFLLLEPNKASKMHVKTTNGNEKSPQHILSVLPFLSAVVH